MNNRKITRADFVFDTDIDKDYPGRNMAIRAMKDITKIIPDAFMFSEDIDFSEKTDRELFDLFIERLNQSKIRLSNINYRIAYNKRRRKYYLGARAFHNYAGDTLYAICISVLPDLLKINSIFHDLLCMLLGVYAEHGVAIISSDYYDGYEIEELRESLLENDDKDLEREINSFDKHGKNYEELIKASTYDSSKVDYMLNHSDIPSNLRDRIIEWHDSIVSLMSSVWDITSIAEDARINHIKENEIEEEELYENGNPVEIDQVFRIVWFREGSYKENICSMLGEYAGQFGEIYPNLVKDCYTKADIDSLSKEFYNTYGNIPELLAKSMTLGTDLFEEVYSYTQLEKEKQWRQKRRRKPQPQLFDSIR